MSTAATFKSTGPIMDASAQHDETDRRARIALIAAVNAERARCASIFAKAIQALGAGPEQRALLQERLAHIWRPWRSPRRRAVPCCSRCDEPGHYAPRCPQRGQAS